jgi:hypothetical protein
MQPPILLNEHDRIRGTCRNGYRNLRRIGNRLDGLLARLYESHNVIEAGIAD